MKWQGRRGSENIDDRRGMSGKSIALGGGGFAIIALIIGLLMGKDPQSLLSDLIQQNNNTPSTEQVQETQQEKELAQYVSVVLADNEEVWGNIFKQYGTEYPKPTLVLFRNSVQSACGGASSQSGPFYCPGDQKIYLDLSFFDELTKRLGAHGDFALAYVIAHEVGHHIQHTLGTTDKMRKMQASTNEKDANKLSVALELQADFYAGVWAHHNQKLFGVLEDGDIEEALSAANAVGDDKLQKQAQGYVVPDAFTHGTSQQRMLWFKKGFTTGDIKQGNTFDEVL